MTGTTAAQNSLSIATTSVGGWTSLKAVKPTRSANRTRHDPLLAAQPGGTRLRPRRVGEVLRQVRAERSSTRRISRAACANAELVGRCALASQVVEHAAGRLAPRASAAARSPIAPAVPAVIRASVASR